MAKKEDLEEVLRDLEEAAEKENRKATEKAAEMTEETVEETEAEEETAETEEEADEEAEAEEAETGDEAGEGRKFFKKKEKVDKKQELINELEDRVKRQMAEFDNFRKRTEKEKSQMFDMGAKSVIEKFLPVIDNFERGLATIPEEEKGSPFAEGMQMIYKQMLTELEKIDVKPIEAVGKEFNPDFHNAVMHIDDENYGESEVVEEFQKGYTYKDSVVRHSMVKVAN